MASRIGWIDLSSLQWVCVKKFMDLMCVRAGTSYSQILLSKKFSGTRQSSNDLDSALVGTCFRAEQLTAYR